jgi:hypothetical protein
MMERFSPRPELSGRLISLRVGLRIDHAALEFWTDLEAKMSTGDGEWDAQYALSAASVPDS